MDLRDLGLVLARPALERLVLEVAVIRVSQGVRSIGARRRDFNLRNRRHQSANLANVHAERVGNLKETLLQEGRRSVRNHTITLHFSDP